MKSLKTLARPRSMTALAAIAVASLLVAGGAAKGQSVISEPFDSGTAGWSFYNDGSSLGWFASGGNPGGRLAAVDDAGGTYWGFVAGPAFLGDRSCLYGGVLRCDLITNFASTAGSSESDVTIIGGGLTLVYDLAVPVANVWSLRAVPLTEVGWRKTSLSGSPPTAQEFMAALANITAIRFRAEFSTNADRASIDNVYMGAFDLTQPESVAVCVGTNAVFTVVASGGLGGGPFSYAWRRGGVPISSASNASAATSSLTITNVQLSDAPGGVFDCVVTNLGAPSSSCPSITTAPVVLTVLGLRCSPADVAFDSSAPLPPLGPCVLNEVNNGVTEGDYNHFFATFFDAGATCDIADDSGQPLPPFGNGGIPPFVNNGVTEGDYNLFFSVFFDGCQF